MRVLHLYAGNLYGGIETYLVTLARYSTLSPTLEPHFGLCFPGKLREELVATGVPVHDLGSVRFSRPWTILKARRRLRVLLREIRFDAVVTHACWPHAVFASVVVKAGVLLFNRVHDVLTGQNWVERLASQTTPKLVLANSQFSAGSVSTVFHGSRVEILYPATMVARIERPDLVRRAIRAELGTAENDVVLLQASRFERWKGHSVLLKALSSLPTTLPGWEVWITGDPQKSGEQEYVDELKVIAKRGNIEGRTRFLGRWPNLPQLMAASDVFCQPNTSAEPFGLVLVEALYSQLPVIASAAGGPLEILDETCGILTPPGNQLAVANALEVLIRDPVRRRQLGAAGPQRAMHLCDPRRHVANLMDFVGEGGL